MPFDGDDAFCNKPMNSSKLYKNRQIADLFRRNQDTIPQQDFESENSNND